MSEHREAFALMWYACKCGHRERIWNSRDGVTPFGLSCPSCGQPSLYHVEWGRDLRAPEHVPHRGQRVWRDGTPDEAVAIMTKRIKASHAFGWDVGEEQAALLIQQARDGHQDSDFRRGWPTLVVVVDKGVVPVTASGEPR